MMSCSWSRSTIAFTRSMPRAARCCGRIRSSRIPAGVTTVPSGDTGSGDITPEIGITSTPTIDPATGLLYLTAKTKEIVSGFTHYVYRLHKINIQNGVDTSTVIGDTIFSGIYYYRVTDTGTGTDPYVNGTGAGAI